MKYVLAFIFLALCFPAQAARIEVSGPFMVEDGDTLAFGHERVRFLCIDAPETDQPFGAESTALLQHLAQEKNVTCVGYFRDKYKRLLGFCYAGGKPSLNFEMVKAGLAHAQGGKGCSAFKDVGRRAKEERRGLWAEASPTLPSSWRKTHPRPHPEEPAR
jgi:endonuclease YncB( thermonuclease family)